MERLSLRAPRGKRAALTVPGDKSLSHRAFLLAAVADGTTRISGANTGADVRATLAALRHLGVDIERTGDRFLVHGTQVLATPKRPIDCANSATAMRLLAGLLAGRVDAVLDGDASLRRRPMTRVVQPLRVLGAKITCARQGLPPLHVRTCERLAGGRVRLALPSAQVESALLLAGLRARSPVIIANRWTVRDHTRRMLRAFHARISVHGTKVRIDPGVLRSPGQLVIPGDLSAATFFICAAAVVAGSRLTLRRIGVNPTRTKIVELLQRMGVDVTLTRRVQSNGEAVADLIVRGGRPLRAITTTAALAPQIIDEIPALCALAATASGVSVIRGAGELRYKESDRLETTLALLEAFGVRAQLHNDTIAVHGGEVRAPARVRTSGDHRIGMAAAVLAAAARAAITIEDSRCIQTSFPRFAQAWRAAF